VSNLVDYFAEESLASPGALLRQACQRAWEESPQPRCPPANPLRLPTRTCANSRPCTRGVPPDDRTLRAIHKGCWRKRREPPVWPHLWKRFGRQCWQWKNTTRRGFAPELSTTSHECTGGSTRSLRGTTGYIVRRLSGAATCLLVRQLLPRPAECPHPHPAPCQIRQT